MKRYLLNLLIAIDQGGNAFFGGNPDETIAMMRLNTNCAAPINLAAFPQRSAQ